MQTLERISVQTNAHVQELWFGYFSPEKLLNKTQNVDVTYSSKGIKYLIMNTAMNMRALPMKLMQPITRLKNGLPLKYLAHPGLQ